MRSWCECGEVLSNSQNPDIEYLIYSDKEWIDIVEAEDAYPSPLNIPFPRHTAWLCPSCQRVHIWRNGSMERVALYEFVNEPNGLTQPSP